MENFITKKKERIQKSEMVEFSDLMRMKNYQLALIDTLCYQTKRHDELLRNKLMLEIKAVESWLKIQYNLFMNDNNRKLIG